MKNSIMAFISRYVAENMDWFIQKYSSDSSVLKSFLYDSMSARKNDEDRKLADLLYEQLLKVPEERRKKTAELLINDVLNYMTNTSKNYFAAVIDVNSNCNLSCDNCANSMINCSENINWSLEQINAVVEALKPYTRLIFVSGGEPYMNPNLIDAIERNPDIEFVTFTNGSMLKQYEKAVERDLKNLFVMVSIDGNESYHDYKRGNGVYQNALNAIKYFREQGYLCGISSVVEENNIDQLFSEEYISFVRGLDASALYFLKDAHNGNEEFNQHYIELSDKLQNTLFGTFPVFNMPYCEKTLSKDKCCFAGRQWFRVNANFEVTTCPFSNQTYGNIQTEKSKELVKKLKNNEEPPKSSCWS